MSISMSLSMSYLLLKKYKSQNKEDKKTETNKKTIIQRA
jgi:hypothetical protein